MNAPRTRTLVHASALAGVVLAIGASFGLAQDTGEGTQKLAIDGLTIRYPEGWRHQRHAGVDRLAPPLSTVTAADAAPGRGQTRVSIYQERRASHAEAVKRLREIELEQVASAAYVAIGGWPALERKHVQPRPQAGEAENAAGGGVSDKVLVITTAIAADDLLIRVESWLPDNAGPALVAEVQSIGRSLVAPRRAEPSQLEQELQNLRKGAAPGRPISVLPPMGPTPSGPQVSMLPEAESSLDAAGAPVAVRTGGGRDSEIEVAVSGNGRNLVIGTNNGYSFSTDGGVTWAASAIGLSNDPSVAWGPSGGANGTFYAANINTPSTDIRASTNGGANFVFRGNAYTCGQNGDPACPAGFPDQEHIAADRVNTTATGDQVYSAWRHLDGNWGIVCSVDGGATWSNNAFFTAGDFPRPSVGQDGTVYVTYRQGGNVMMRRFNSCATNQNPMVAAPVATIVAGITDVACATPGLDRCNFRNTLSSPIIAVDDTNANHIYVAYAVNTNPGGGGFPTCTNQATCNENVIVQDSPDQGTTWNAADPNRTVRINANVTARRFMPWVCSVGGVAYVAWYDRRGASAGGTAVSNNSLTDFYRASASLDGGGNLVAGTEFRVNDAGTADPQCEAGAATGSLASWPWIVDQSRDSESCSVQPQMGGMCCVPGDIDGGGRCLNPSGASSQQRCDFDQTACPTGEQCAANVGSPKYGDYNGVACGTGRFNMAWASAVAPTSGIGTSTNIDTFFASELVCCVPRIDAPASVTLPPTCAGSTGQAALRVCNTGFTDLVVSGIASSNAQFSVPAAYPVTIAAGSCHDFDARFTPTSRGPKAAVLSISSNDPLRPSVTVAASGLGKGLVSITCPADVTAPNDPGQCSAVVDPGAPTVDAEGCSTTVVGLRSDGQALTDPYPVGSTHITWTATDGGGNSLSCGQDITVNDVEPPSIIGANPVPAVLWPPNHQMRNVAIDYTVTDNCDVPAAIACELAVSSNEPVNGQGDGNTSPDWLVLGDHAVRLRSERRGGGSGRIYTVGIACEDTKGNASQTSVQVTVPKSQGNN